MTAHHIRPLSADEHVKRADQAVRRDKFEKLLPITTKHSTESW